MALKLVRQRRKMDCGVATLATLLNIPYEEANDAFVLATGKTASKGYYQADVIKAAKYRGVELVRVRKDKFDPDSTTGILGVGATSDWDHLVILHNGTVYDAEDDELTDLNEYLIKTKQEAWSVLIQKEPQEE